MQALSLLNSRFNLVMAEKFAARVANKQDSLQQQIQQAIRLVLQRDPSDSELEAYSAYAREHGMNNLCRFLFNLSEFIYID